jgi:assimilatory nitrate reductase catalytic subunit
MFLERFATSDGRARFHVTEHQPPAESPDPEFPLYLTTGRTMTQYQSGTQTRRVARLVEPAPEAYVEIHPSMAQTYGISEGERVRVTTRRGRAEVVARLTSSIRMDTLFIPFHYAAAGRANLLTNPALDQVSRMPEFKICVARIEKGTTC